MKIIDKIKNLFKKDKKINLHNVTVEKFVSDVLDQITLVMSKEYHGFRINPIIIEASEDKPWNILYPTPLNVEFDIGVEITDSSQAEGSIKVVSPVSISTNKNSSYKNLTYNKIKFSLPIHSVNPKNVIKRDRNSEDDLMNQIYVNNK